MGLVFKVANRKFPKLSPFERTAENLLRVSIPVEHFSKIDNHGRKKLGIVFKTFMKDFMRMYVKKEKV